MNFYERCDPQKSISNVFTHMYLGKGLEFETWLLNAIASERRQRMEENRRVKESLEQS